MSEGMKTPGSKKTQQTCAPLKHHIRELHDNDKNLGPNIQKYKRSGCLSIVEDLDDLLDR